MADLSVEVNQKLLPRLISTGLGLLFTFGTLVVAMKYLIPRLDPSRSEKERSKERAAALLRRLCLDHTKLELDEYELCIAQDLVDPKTMQNSWSDVGGLEDVVQQLKETVIWPLRYSTTDGSRVSRICRPPKGVLLYGPPGCGKTLLARVTARESGARFINLQASTLLDKWYGESQKRTAALFTLARKLAPCIIFIDEIDAFLRSRSRDDHEATALMKTQFMTFWDGLQAGTADSSGGIVIIGATNRLADIDEAILRRMPARLFVSPPDSVMRSSILRVVLRDENVAPDVWGFIDELAERCNSFSGSDLLELCRQAAMIRLRWHYSQMEERQTGTSLPTNGGNHQENIENFMISRSDFEAAFAKLHAAKHAQSKPQKQTNDNINSLTYRLLHLLSTLQDTANISRVDNNIEEEFHDTTSREYDEGSASNDVSPD